MELPFSKKKIWKSIYVYLKKQKNGIIVKSVKNLNLFTINQTVGQGLPLWLPKGATIRRTIERYIVDKEIELGYDHVYTPVLG